MKNENKIKTILSIVIIVISLGFTGYILLKGSAESNFNVLEDSSQLEISGGVYNKVIDIDSETLISMVSPKEVLRRTNGSAVGDTLKGTFTIEGDLSVYLNLSDKTLDWIEIINGEDYYYINIGTNQETLNLYNNLLNLIN